MFLVRSAFWLSVVILLLPAEEKSSTAKFSDAQEKITTGTAIMAAQTTVDDLSGFCVRNQAACDTGKAALDVFIRKAQYGANMLNRWVNDASTVETAPVAPGQQAFLNHPAVKDTASTAFNHRQVIHLAGNNNSSQQTLTREDLSPTWGGPTLKQQRA